MNEHIPAINNQENKPFVIQLCSVDFLSNFSRDFLDNVHLVAWHRNLGPKDNPHYTKQECCTAVIIDADLSYSKQNMLAWTRILIPNGLLILEAIPNRMLEILELNYSSILEYVPNDNENVWIFRKKFSLSSIDINNELIKLYGNSLSDNEMLTALSKLEQIDSQYAGLTTTLIARLMIYKRLGLEQLAMEALQQFIDANPIHSHHITAILNLICYSDKQYQTGFRLRKILLDKFGSKHRTLNPPKEEYFQKRWEGQDLNNKTMVIWTEFGLGDEIMFAQFAYYFKNQGVKKVIVIAKDPIIDILKTSLDIDQVISISQIEKLPKFDYWTYPHDILAYIGTPLSQLKKRTPYLFANKTLVNQYKSIFENKNSLKIGIVWRGNPTHENDIFRSIYQLEYIEDLFKIPEIEWYCFQKQCNEDELALLEKYKVPHITQNFDDFTHTAAAMENIDYLITVDTSTAHLAGALGVQTLLLLPYIVDWRWGFEGTSNYWYPNMHSFRCKKPAPDWKDAFEELKSYLISLIRLQAEA